MKRTLYRDAATGEFVTEEHAEANPGTTVSEEVDIDQAGVTSAPINRERMESMTVGDLARSFRASHGFMVLYQGPEDTEIVVGQSGLHNLVIAMMAALEEEHGDEAEPPGPIQS